MGAAGAAAERGRMRGTDSGRIFLYSDSACIYIDIYIYTRVRERGRKRTKSEREKLSLKGRLSIFNAIMSGGV